MIIERLVVGPIEANCYIVADEKTKEGLVIDPGDDAPDILERIAQLGLKIKYIVLTHSHFDHVSATAAVKKATGAKLMIHKDDAVTLNDGMLARLAGFDLAEGAGTGRAAQRLGGHRRRRAALHRPPRARALARLHRPLRPGRRLHRRHPVRRQYRADGLTRRQL